MTGITDLLFVTALVLPPLAVVVMFVLAIVPTHHRVKSIARNTTAGTMATMQR